MAQHGLQLHFNHMLHPILVWLAKCCKIQQLAYLYSATYIYIRQYIFFIPQFIVFLSILFHIQPKLFSFNNNICSTSIAIFNFNLQN